MAQHSKLGKKLIRSLTQAVAAMESGQRDKLTIRTAVLPPPPHDYTAADIQVTRRKLGVSQGVFAKIMGVSLILAQSWEQGTRKPSTMACRLLDEINRDLGRWTTLLNAA